MLVNMINIDQNHGPDFDIEYTMSVFESEKKPIYPQAGKDLFEFLLRQKDQGGDVSLCPRCSAIFDKQEA